MFEVFDRMTHQWTRTCYEQLKDFIYRRQEVLFDLADAQREAIDSLDALEDYNRDMRSRFIASIGGLEETA